VPPQMPMIRVLIDGGIFKVWREKTWPTLRLRFGQGGRV
jgi:hypothetical protein